MTFRALHHRATTDAPLILPGPWDAASARVFADAGFAALATPSAGVSASLGHDDGDTPPDEMFAAVARIVRAVDIPVSADIESGYGLAPAELAERLLETGAVGCNLEDSAHGRLLDPAYQADRLAAVRQAAGPELFLNARVDTFVHGSGDLDDTLARARLYLEAGADGIYPITAPPDVLPRLATTIKAPLNALASKDHSPAELARLGATRITFGPGLLRETMAHTRHLAETLLP
ncbi:isocitrate lyase/PEP mutase family protein [Streptomyces cucumeris]|uniref:isocitrate lyase/PEP mutase family protein n=1 Tax=Streptomyces cucumeris TaxID=2962890 RepID=UPI003D70D8AA